MGVYIDGLDMPKPIKGIKTCYDILIKSDGTVEEYDSDGRNEYKAEEIDLVRCGECKYIYTDEGVTLCGVWGKYTFKDGFCYQGERRADEEHR